MPAAGVHGDHLAQRGVVEGEPQECKFFISSLIFSDFLPLVTAGGEPLLGWAVDWGVCVAWLLLPCLGGDCLAALGEGVGGGGGGLAGGPCGGLGAGGGGGEPRDTVGRGGGGGFTTLLCTLVLLVS